MFLYNISKQNKNDNWEKNNSIYHSMKKKIGIDCESRNNPHIYSQVDF